jgi:hypothetical protein
VDAFVPRDAPGPACGTFALPCTTSSDCGPYACDPSYGICVPIGRASCGGFAGAECMGSLHTECRWLEGADYGPCLTPAEDACACLRAPGVFSCP